LSRHAIVLARFDEGAKPDVPDLATGEVGLVMILGSKTFCRRCAGRQLAAQARQSLLGEKMNAVAKHNIEAGCSALEHQP
jgi:hypothetical protein